MKDQQPTTPAKRPRRLRRKILLAIVSALLTLIATEAAYRIKLSRQTDGFRPGQSNTFMAYNQCYVTYDAEYGYRYHPNRQIVGVRVKNGKPVLTFRRTFNSLGNPAVEKTNCNSADLRISVFGDSFSALADDNVVWSDLFEAKLTEQFHKSVCVRNFSREGHGILQMFDVAAAEVTRRKPDAAIIAFITDDLNRDRFWLRTRTIAGRARVFVSRTKSPVGETIDPKRFSELAIIHSGLSREWCRNAIADPPQDDPILSALNDSFSKRPRRKDSAVQFLTLTRSFLYMRLVYGNPYFGLPGHAPIPRIASHDYTDDNQFSNRIAALKKTGVQIYLVHLPQYEELQAGRYLLTVQQRSLLKSLQKLSGRKVVQLLSHIDTRPNAKTCFRLPHDGHPSQKGMVLYADAVLKAIGEKLNRR